MEKKNQSEELTNKFLERVLIARIATVDPEGHPHVVPVWYGWDGESLWISAFASTQKVQHIENNPMISVVIDTTTDHVDNKAVLLEGKAELVRESKDFLQKQTTWIYTRYLGEEGVLEEEPQSWINDKENLLIKLTPTKITNWGL
jgi:PPOX class probable F420-dependent enzyme